jgi:hypothetical protein
VGFWGNNCIRLGVYFQIDIPLKAPAGLTLPNTDFQQFAKTAVFEAQNKHLLGQNPLRVWIDTV